MNAVEIQPDAFPSITSNGILMGTVRQIAPAIPPAVKTEKEWFR
jgi:hypothetical protein